MEQQYSRRDFMGQGVKALLASYAAKGQAAQPKPPALATHAPRTFAELNALPARQATLLAALTASGCEAAAYYKREGEHFVREGSLDLYPDHNTQFAEQAAYNVASAEKTRAGEDHYIAVEDELGQMQGFVVLRPSKASFSRVQTPAEEQDATDLHEPLASRLAKYAMAEHIIAHGKNELMAQGGFSAALAPRASLTDKQRYYRTLREDFLQVLGEGTQAAHVQGVADLMMLAVDSINANKPIISEGQKQMLYDLTVLHDVGKAQASTHFLNKKWRNKDKKGTPEQEQIEHYFMGLNHNHPLFSRLILGAYPDEALVTAAHHHGLLRYSDDKLHKGMGDDYQKYKILTDNVSYEALPALSKVMRICDVTESMTGRANIPMTNALAQLAQMAGLELETQAVKPVSHDCNTIDPDYLCMLIDSGFFKHYGQLRAQQPDGWKDPNGAAKYNEAEVEKLSAAVLDAFGWQQRGQQVKEALCQQIEQSAFVQQNKSAARLIS